MKKLLMVVACVLIGALIAWAQELQTQFLKTVALTTVPEILAPAGTVKARTFIFIGLNAAHTTNTSPVWLQMNNSTNNAIGAIPLWPGERIAITVDSVTPRTVDWYIDVETTNDGVSCKIIQ